MQTRYFSHRPREVSRTRRLRSEVAPVHDLTALEGFQGELAHGEVRIALGDVPEAGIERIALDERRGLDRALHREEPPCVVDLLQAIQVLAIEHHEQLR